MVPNITVNISGYNPVYTTIPKSETQLITVHQISLFGVISNFLLYLCLHIVIGKLLEKQKKITTPTKEDNEKLKFLTFLFKWWPAIYLIFILLQYI